MVKRYYVPIINVIISENDFLRDDYLSKGKDAIMLPQNYYPHDYLKNDLFEPMYGMYFLFGFHLEI